MGKADSYVRPKCHWKERIGFVESTCAVDACNEMHYARDATTVKGQPLPPTENSAWGTYNRPVANTADTPIFLLMGICSRQIDTIGKSNIAKSETTFIIPPDTNTRSSLIQCPGSEGNQSFFLGMQGQISIGRFAR